ncbi:SMI1/KNR4 family protein [Streptomyces coeruleoprunus]|uniref:SMI1/KNR4 family protein n=1 Tax=Streptomyces coeruleoprunus TaxID=285563 RepID=A0ABV9XQE0_9ACTN
MTENEELLRRVAAAAPGVHPWTGKPRPRPATADDVAAAEATLGFPLPPLLTALYTRVADGRFGPDYGLLPLGQAVSCYDAYRSSGRGEDAEWPWPEGVVPIADLGCAMLACVDCRSDTAAMLLFDPNPGEVEYAWYVLAPGLAAWLTDWLEGTGWFDEEEGFEGDRPHWPGFRARALTGIRTSDAPA